MARTFAPVLRSSNPPDSSGNLSSAQVDANMSGIAGIANAAIYNWQVASQAAMLALSTAVVGDLATRSDNSTVFLLMALPASTLGNWQQLEGATSAVLTVAGRTGNIVLGAGDVTYTPSGTGNTPQTIAARIAGGYISFSDYGCNGNGTADNSTAINNAVAAAAAAGKTVITVPAGVFNVTTKPANFTQGILWIGEGPATSVFQRSYTPGSASEGFFTWVGGGSAGGGVVDCGFLASNTTTSGACWAFTATASVRPGNMIFMGNNITAQAGSSWAYDVYSDGSLYITGGSNGIRDMYFFGNSFFGATSDTIFINNGVHWFMFGNTIDAAGGTIGSIHITGGGTTNSNSSTIVISGDIVGTGGLTLDNCTGITYHGYVGGTVSVASTCTSSVVGGALVGTVSNSSTTTAIYGNTSQASNYTASNAGAGNCFTARYNSSNERSGMYSATSGQTYFGENINYSSGDTYSVNGMASRWGNPGGGANPWSLYVAVSGTAGNAISWIESFHADSSGNITFKQQVTGTVFNSTNGGAGNCFVARYNGSNEQSGMYSNSAGATYFAENVNYNGADQYSVGTPSASRWGNPGGSATVAWSLYVAGPGSAGTNITWTTAISVDNSGNLFHGAAFGIRGKAFTANGAATSFTYPANTSYQYITTSAASLATTLPATSAAVDGLIISFCAGSSVATATWVAGTGGATIVGAPSSLTANTPVRFIYHHATTSWYPF